jgi:hypothetical protein
MEEERKQEGKEEAGRGRGVVRSLLKSTTRV